MSWKYIFIDRKTIRLDPVWKNKNYLLSSLFSKKYRVCPSSLYCPYYLNSKYSSFSKNQGKIFMNLIPSRTKCSRQGTLWFLFAMLIEGQNKVMEVSGSQQNQVIQWSPGEPLGSNFNTPTQPSNTFWILDVTRIEFYSFFCYIWAKY